IPFREIWETESKPGSAAIEIDLGAQDAGTPLLVQLQSLCQRLDCSGRVVPPVHFATDGCKLRSDDPLNRAWLLLQPALRLGEITESASAVPQTLAASGAHDQRLTDHQWLAGAASCPDSLVVELERGSWLVQTQSESGHLFEDGHHPTPFEDLIAAGQ